MWARIVSELESELNETELNTWIRPIKAETSGDSLVLLAPNRFIVNWISNHYGRRIVELGQSFHSGGQLNVEYRVGSSGAKGNGASAIGGSANTKSEITTNGVGSKASDRLSTGGGRPSVIPEYTFDRFVSGGSNQIARAAAMQVAENPGNPDFNPLFIYGGVGLGKTHLMHAAGNEMLKRDPDAKIIYLHSEKFVGDMVRALQHSAIDDFKRHYRSADALLIDDIQFFAGKDRSQEEFFHTFNTLLERRQQVILTCDRYPRDMERLEERLKSRFGWGLTVAVEPAELETRVAILMSKAAEAGISLSDDVAFFIGQSVRTNIRELEGALKKVIAQHNFTGRPITVDFARESLRDLLASQDKLITVENIQRTVAEVFKVRHADLLSPKRTRSVAWPRQVAMALAKELTTHSLPEIGRSFGGRDHTTVLHGCRKVNGVLESDSKFAAEYESLKRMLSS